MKRKFLGILLAGVMALSVTGCGSAGSSKGGSGDSSSQKVGLVTCVGGLGDHSLGDVIYDGVKKAQEEVGFDLDYSEPMESAEMEPFIREYCESGDYDLIVVAGYEAIDPVAQLSEEYPDQKFYGYDISSEGVANFATSIFDHSQMSFAAGVLAALVEPLGELEVNGKKFTWTPSGKLGTLVGTEVPTTVPALSAFAAGAKYINPDIDVSYGQIGSWNDPSKAKEIALSMYDDGIEIIYANAGGSQMGILDAAVERDTFLLGFDIDATKLDETHVFASATNLAPNVISEAISAFFKDGTFAGGTNRLCGMKEQSIIYKEGVNISDETKAIVDEVVEKIANGEIAIPQTWDEYDSFSETYK